MQNNPNDLYILLRANEVKGCYLYKLASGAKPRLYFSTVKSVLDRLERDHLVFCKEEVVNGRTRQVYFITVEGIVKLKQLRTFFQKLVTDYRYR